MEEEFEVPMGGIKATEKGPQSANLSRLIRQGERRNGGGQNSRGSTGRWCDDCLGAKDDGQNNEAARREMRCDCNTISNEVSTPPPSPRRGGRGLALKCVAAAALLRARSRLPNPPRIDREHAPYRCASHASPSARAGLSRLAEVNQTDKGVTPYSASLLLDCRISPSRSRGTQSDIRPRWRDDARPRRLSSRRSVSEGPTVLISASAHLVHTSRCFARKAAKEIA